MSNKEVLRLNKITKTRLKELCKKHKLYQTPHLNDQLYLHYQGFQAIENLDEYTGLKCLWLESNAISEIQGLDCQPELKCLFLQNNLIKKIENLHSCLVLDTLNLASNHITRIENCGVDVLPVLSTLNLSRNYLRKSEALRELVNCRNLCSLDLSHNRIDDILVVKIFANMPELRVLVLQGNPVVSQVPQYRKTLILECKNLTYLDSRPVFPKDRACAEAWKRGGYEEERRENERWVREDRKKIRDSVNATLRLRQKQGGGDVQLLESTDDEEENSKPKKLRKIPEEVMNADLEIIGVDQAGKNKDSQTDMELKSSESSLSDSSASEGSVLKSADGLDEEPNESVIDIQLQANLDQTSIEATSNIIQSQYLEQLEQILEIIEEKDLVTSGDTINKPKATELHDEEAKFNIEPTAFEDATQSVINKNKIHLISDNEEDLTKNVPPNSVTMRSATSFSQQTTICNESSRLVTSLTSDPSLASDSSSNGSSIFNDDDTVEVSDNADNTSEYMLREDCSINSNLKQEYRKKEASKSEEDTAVAVRSRKFSFDISSESQFGDSELSLPSITEEEEESLQNLDQTFEIRMQGKIQLQHSTCSEKIRESPTSETDRNLNDVEDSIEANMQTISEVEDSGYFNICNSVEASEKTLKSNDEYEGLPALECVSSNQEDDSEISVWQDLILKKLLETEANRANEGKNETTDSSPPSEMMTSSKANTLSSSLFVENSDEEMTLDELDASTWLGQNLAKSVETANQEPFTEKIEEEEEVSSEKTIDSASTMADGEKSSSEKSYQSDGSSLLEYILKISRETEYDKSSPEICREKREDEIPVAGNNEDEAVYENVCLQTIFTTNEEEKKSASEELNHWVDNDEDEKISLQNMLTTISRNREENSITVGLDDEQLSQWLEKNEERALEEKLSLQQLLATLEEEQEEKLPSDEFNKRRIHLEQWLGKNESKVGDSDEDEDLGEKQDYIYTKSIEDDEESLSSMYNTELGLSEETALEEDDMLQSILKKIEDEEHFALETVTENSGDIQEWLDEAVEKSYGGLSDGLGPQNSFSCSSPYEEVFDNKHFSLVSEAGFEVCNISQERAELTQEEVSEDSSEDSILTRLTIADQTVTLRELDSGSGNENVPSNDSWWERTLAAARESTEPPKEPTTDDSFEGTINQTQSLEDNVEASALLEQILTKTHETKVEIHPKHAEPPEPPSNDIIDESKPPTTIRDVLGSFNKVAENITTTRYLTTYALTRDYSTQSSDQINRQVEQMNREQRARVSQMIDRVYAQKDKYADNLEVVDGRLMVVKRTTGALEELPLPPTSSSKYTSCGVRTTRANCNDSDSDDDYGTALSEDEPDDDDDGDIEQHASDTKIKKIPYLSAVYGNESSTSTGMEVEENCHWQTNEQTMDSNHKVAGLCDESDAVAYTEWMEMGAPSPAGWVTTEKGHGEAKASLIRKLCGGTTESQTDLTCRKERGGFDFGGAALQDFALSFDEPPEGETNI